MNQKEEMTLGVLQLLCDTAVNQGCVSCAGKLSVAACFLRDYFHGCSAAQVKEGEGNMPEEM